MLCYKILISPHIWLRAIARNYLYVQCYVYDNLHVECFNINVINKV